MTHDDQLRFTAIRQWTIYAIEGHTPYLVAAEAIEGLAARIRDSYSPRTPVRSTTLGAPNEAAEGPVQTPGQPNLTAGGPT